MSPSDDPEVQRLQNENVELLNRISTVAHTVNDVIRTRMMRKEIRTNPAMKSLLLMKKKLNSLY